MLERYQSPAVSQSSCAPSPDLNASAGIPPAAFLRDTAAPVELTVLSPEAKEIEAAFTALGLAHGAEAAEHLLEYVSGKNAFSPRRIVDGQAVSLPYLAEEIESFQIGGGCVLRRREVALSEGPNGSEFPYVRMIVQGGAHHRGAPPELSLCWDEGIMRGLLLSGERWRALDAYCREAGIPAPGADLKDGAAEAELAADQVRITLEQRASMVAVAFVEPPLELSQTSGEATSPAVSLEEPYPSSMRIIDPTPAELAAILRLLNHPALNALEEHGFFAHAGEMLDKDEPLEIDTLWQANTVAEPFLVEFRREHEFVVTGEPFDMEEEGADEDEAFDQGDESPNEAGEQDCCGGVAEGRLQVKVGRIGGPTGIMELALWDVFLKGDEGGRYRMHRVLDLQWMPERKLADAAVVERFSLICSLAAALGVEEDAICFCSSFCFCSDPQPPADAVDDFGRLWVSVAMR